LSSLEPPIPTSSQNAAQPVKLASSSELKIYLHSRHDKLLASDGELIEGLLAILKFELQQVVDAVALITAHFHGTAPARLMEVTVLRHATSQLRPEPRVAVVGHILALEGRLPLLDAMSEGIFAVIVTQDEAASRSLRTEVIVQPLTLVGGNGGCKMMLA